MDRRPKQTFLQRIHTHGQEVHEMMLKITNYQRDANQNYNEYLSLLLVVDYDEDLWEGEIAD